jgi:adenosylmethionine-8-amino-7-oxononanoate aminotransferase
MSYGARLGIEPDLLVLGKGLTSGYSPISAVAVSEDLYRSAISAWPRVFPHSSTNDGHPVAMAAGLAVLDALADGSVYQHVDALGEYVRDRLCGIADRVVPAGKVLGSGLLHFLYLNEENGKSWSSDRALKLVQQSEKRGLLIDSVYGRVVFTPPLITSMEEADEMLSILEDAIAAS